MVGEPPRSRVAGGSPGKTHCCSSIPRAKASLRLTSNQSLSEPGSRLDPSPHEFTAVLMQREVGERTEPTRLEGDCDLLGLSKEFRGRERPNAEFALTAQLGIQLIVL